MSYSFVHEQNQNNHDRRRKLEIQLIKNINRYEQPLEQLKDLMDEDKFYTTFGMIKLNEHSEVIGIKTSKELAIIRDMLKYKFPTKKELIESVYEQLINATQIIELYKNQEKVKKPRKRIIIIYS